MMHGRKNIKKSLELRMYVGTQVSFVTENKQQLHVSAFRQHGGTTNRVDNKH
jgi:hypothetical protein